MDISIVEYHFLLSTFSFQDTTAKPFENILLKPKLAALYMFKINNKNPKTRKSVQC